MILAIDQGTTGTTCLVVDAGLRVHGRGYAELAQHFPQPGWVEHDPEEIWQSVLAAAERAFGDARIRARELDGIGITNQRETALVWERSSGRPVQRAIVWQDRRTADRCADLPAGLLLERTGLVPDPYFSATKLEWLLARHGGGADLACGTVDTWLVWKLTGGRVHVTDASNASRTQLVALATLDWDDELLALFGVGRELLPEIRRSSEVVGEAELLGATLPVAAIAGDQQASLYGHGCVRPGQAKATHGTGTFVLAHAGGDHGPPPGGTLRTAAALVGAPAYALEGSVFVTGAALRWLRDGLGLIDDAAASAGLAAAVEDTGGVYFVPALAGLGSPHWAPHARGLVSGLTGSTRREHLVRAALEATAYQTRDVVEAMGLELDALRVDGGASANPFLMQFEADLLGVPVEVAAERETTALGAAALAALALGLRDGPPEPQPASRYEPRLPREEAERLYAGWREALRRTLVGQGRASRARP
ncbi:MAG TPA: glycerol kinase GlpK [Gaiellaceae bacterium]|nr:glycerol kinase GlpK [Gaiellaceae bacterium]